jgi:hypothetical protein
MSMPVPTLTTARVDIKSAWASKINWTQAVSAFAMMLTFISGGHFDITGDQQAAIVVTIGVACNVATWVMKTWFTPTVSPASLTTAAPVKP